MNRKKEQTKQRVRQRINQQILNYTKEMQMRINLRLLKENPVFLCTEPDFSGNILWVESITVTDITWRTHKSKVSQLFSRIKGLLSRPGKQMK